MLEVKLLKRSIQTGDFTGLAKSYSKNRPDYCASVLNGLLGLIKKSVRDIDFADIGAGTGIWTRMVHSAGVGKCLAIEPNQAMRDEGIADSDQMDIAWFGGSAEKTGLPSHSLDWVTMASSFHWVDFETGVSEFHRILRSDGRFTALWNPRLVEANPILMEIEVHLQKIAPNIKRVSSGRSGITENLTERLESSKLFSDIVYLEGKHTIKMSKERYLGAWRSVNDIQAQLGPDRFREFILFVEKKIADLAMIEATYLTRAWSALRSG